MLVQLGNTGKVLHDAGVHLHVMQGRLCVSLLWHPQVMGRCVQVDQMLPSLIHAQRSEGGRVPAQGNQEEAMNSEHQEVRGK